MDLVWGANIESFPIADDMTVAKARCYVGKCSHFVESVDLRSRSPPFHAFRFPFGALLFHFM